MFILYVLNALYGYKPWTADRHWFQYFS